MRRFTIIRNTLAEAAARPCAVWLFYAGLLLYLLGGLPIRRAELTPAVLYQVQPILGHIGAGLLLLRLLTLFPVHPRYTLSCLCLLAVFRFSYFLSGPRTLNLFQVALVVAASREADAKVALKIYLGYLIFFLLLCPVLYAGGWAGSVVKHIGSLRGGSFGFPNPNTLATFLAMSVFLGLLMARRTRPVVALTVCWMAAALVFFLTLSRTFTILLLALPLLWWLFHRTAPEPGLLAALPAALLLLSVLLAACVGPGYGANTFDSRFSIGALVFQQCGLSLFGQDCFLQGWFRGLYPYHLDVDNGFLSLLLCSGVLPALVTLVFLTLFFRLIGKKGDPLLTAVACCILLSGLMEKVPFRIHHTFLPLLYLPLLGECCCRHSSNPSVMADRSSSDGEQLAAGGLTAEELPADRISVGRRPLAAGVQSLTNRSAAGEKLLAFGSAALALTALVYIFLPWHPRTGCSSSKGTSPWHPRTEYCGPYGTLGGIPCPEGFVRIDGGPDGFSAYVQSLPLARPDSVVTGFDGAPCDSLAPYCHQVVDFPLIDKDEQCADVCLRLWAEYLFDRSRFRRILFPDTQGRLIRYRFGACRPLFDRYLREVFDWCNTESMCASLPVRPTDQVQVGDVFVFEKDARPAAEYGHTVMVAGVAIDPASNRRAVLLIQGSTPACDVHVVADPSGPALSPWHLLDVPSVPSVPSAPSGSSDPSDPSDPSVSSVSSVPSDPSASSVPSAPSGSSSIPILTVGKAVFYPGDLRYFAE